MIVELGKKGTVIRIQKNKIVITLETGEIVEKDKSLLTFPVSLGDKLNIFNNFITAENKKSAKGEQHE